MESDIIPPTCYLLNPKSESLVPFLPSRKWIDSDELSPVRPVSFPSRDGSKIHGYLTLPKSHVVGPFPLILNIHGGADSRVEATQAKVMRAALRKARKTHEVAIHSFGGHGFYGARSKIKFFVRVAEFLDKHMK